MQFPGKKFQRFEFLGDSLLEFLVMTSFGRYYLFRNQSSVLTPHFFYKIKCFFLSNMAMVLYTMLFKFHRYVQFTDHKT